MAIVKRDSEKVTCLSSCSENIINFINRLDNKDPIIKWSRLDKDGCRQEDGSYFRIVSSIRDAKEQIKLFEKGRTGVKYTTDIYLLPNDDCAFSNSRKYPISNRGTVKNESAVSTMAWAGESRHNWGLAVDLCLRKFGDKKFFDVSDGLISIQNYYSLVGITELAKDCGLDWGGLWSDFEDVLHFEDKKYSIPSEKYHYDKNMTFGFVKNLSGGIVAGKKEKNKTSFLSSILVGSHSASFLLGAFLLYKLTKRW